MHQRKYSEDTDPGFAASLRRFEKLTLEEQLPILAFVLREELNAAARAPRRGRERERPAPAARARAPLSVVPAAKSPPVEDASPASPTQPVAPAPMPMPVRVAEPPPRPTAPAPTHVAAPVLVAQPPRPPATAAPTPPAAASMPAPELPVPAVPAPVATTVPRPAPAAAPIPLNALPAPPAATAPVSALAATADMPAPATALTTRAAQAPAATAKPRVIEAELLPDSIGAPTSRTAKRRTRPLVPGTANASGPRTRSIAATIAIIFPLAVASMLWHSPAVSPVPAVQEEPSQPAVVGAAQRAQPRPFAVAPPAQPSPPPAEVPKPVVQGGAIARVQDPHAMPVTLYFRRRGFHSDPEDRRKINWFMEGRLTNLSEIPMNIEIRAESLSTLSTSQIQIDVAPHTERDFGVDDGLEMHPGDKLTLMSAPYSDMVVGGIH